jgi:hypothetical protein
MSEVTEVLVASRELISNPNCWTKYTLARAADGSLAEPTDEAAVCWCAVGAIYKAANASDDLAEDAIEFLYKAGAWSPVGEWNDVSSHTTVIHTIKTAIELSKNV